MDIKKMIHDHDWMMGNLTLKLVNKEMNAELLKKVPHKDFLDLAAIMIVSLQKGFQTYTVTVDYDMLKVWEKDFEKVYRWALRNLASEKYSIKTINELLSGYMPDHARDVLPMYVLTNEKYLNGAAHMLNEDIFRDFSDEYSTDIFVIPSSVHDLILIPVDELYMVADDLTEIVQQVNETRVLPGDRLSDHVYVYKREGGWSW